MTALNGNRGREEPMRLKKNEEQAAAGRMWRLAGLPKIPALLVVSGIVAVFAAQVWADGLSVAGEASAVKDSSPFGADKGGPLFLIVNNPEALEMTKEEALKKVMDEIPASLKESDKVRFKNGARMVAELWKPADGKWPAYVEFVKKSFVPSGEALERMFARYESNLESINGRMLAISRDISRPVQLDMGDPLPIDYLFSEYNPASHLFDDMFANKLAFIALLNFPTAPLSEKLKMGEQWTRREWAVSKVADSFRDRIPAQVIQKVGEVFTRVDNYIAEYNIYMGRVVGRDKKPMFPDGLKLISHWGLRDELKALYAAQDSLPRQEAIYRIMLRIIDGSIPNEVINRNNYLWDPETNELFDPASLATVKSAGGEGDARYDRLLQVFRAERLIDPYTPSAPTHIGRRFERDRQIPEDEVEKLLVSVLDSPEAKRTASLIEKRLARSLRPFDIWYNGFKPGTTVREDELDARVRARYPSLAAFQKDIPNILVKLGFAPKVAKYVSGFIEVDPARGAGHAMGAEIRTDKAHLRTRVPKDGMNYKGFNIAMHELGHCVEQVLSLNKIDFYSLRGVPNTAFTESFAFMFQAKDLDVLGIEKSESGLESIRVLNDFWMTYEISGVSIVDMRVWRWMYAHPEAGSRELKEAVIKIAKDVWDRYFAGVIGSREVFILAVYSHMIDAALYLPDYPLGHLIDFQVGEFMKGKNLAAEMSRVVASGSVTPDQWMRKATGASLSSAILLDATKAALDDMERPAVENPPSENPAVLPPAANKQD